MKENKETNSIFDDFNMDMYAFRFIKWWAIIMAIITILFLGYYVLYYEYYRLSCGTGSLNIYKSAKTPLPLYNFGL